MRKRLTINLLVAACCFAVLNAMIDVMGHLWIQSWLIDAGEKYLGGQVMRLSGRIGWGTDGPFRGDDVTAWWCNGIVAYGPFLIAGLAAFAPAACVYWFCAVRARPRRSRDGITRCGRCGYRLQGLREPRCPECGIRI